MAQVRQAKTPIVVNEALHRAFRRKAKNLYFEGLTRFILCSNSLKDFTVVIGQ